MRYALLIYDDPDQWTDVSPDEYAAFYAEYAAIAEMPSTTGGAQLQPATTARSVRVRDGKPMTSDGPFAETKEVLGGFFMVDVASREEAEKIAARIPSARVGGTVEVRPVVER